MLRKNIITAFAASFMMSPAFSQETLDFDNDSSFLGYGEMQVIIITPNGFFPQITHVTAGEKIKFYNQAEGSRTVAAVTDVDGDGIDEFETPSWKLSALAHGAYQTIEIQPDMVLKFGTNEGAEFAASFSFDPPPVLSDETGSLSD